MTDRKGPVLIEIDAAASPAPSPAEAPPPPDAPLPQGRAIATIATLSARRVSWLGRFFWAALLAVLGYAVSVAAWGFVEGLFARAPVLGWIGLGLGAALVLAALLIALREAAGFARLGRLDAIRGRAEHAASTGDLAAARGVLGQLDRLYSGRAELRLARETLARRLPEILDADAALGLAEDTLLAPIDRAAEREVEAAARQVATVTALVPLAFADVIAALVANLRMIRRIAELYGGRGGTLGAWRLTRAVLAHLVATGAVAVGDDLLGSVAGGSILSKISRRFGEGLVNGALTARVGVAAMEVCRPLPFGTGHRPGVAGLVRRALTGLFDRGGSES